MSLETLYQRIGISINFMPMSSSVEYLLCRFSANDFLTALRADTCNLANDYDFCGYKVGTRRTKTSVSRTSTIRTTCSPRVRRGIALVKAARKKGRRAQNGVQAIFSTGGRRQSRSHLIAGLISTGAGVALWIWIVLAHSASSVLLVSGAMLLVVQGTGFFVYSLATRRSLRRDNKRLGFYGFEDENEPIISPSSPAKPVFSRWRNPSAKQYSDLPVRIYKILVVTILAGILLMTFVSFSTVNPRSQHHTDLVTRGTVTSPTAAAITPRFYAVSNLAEAIVSNDQAYTGTVGINSDDFIIVQVAYSAGSGGNLPDISNITDTQSNIYTRLASASPGIATNFWEQAWTARATSTTNSTTIAASPDWLGCQSLCVTSIIMTMSVGRYRGVAGIGASTTIAPSTFSNSQSVNVTATPSNSILVELLSHGASNNCEIDAPQPDSGQTSRNCFTGTTERTELFDHSITANETYTESYTWAQVEVQRGIYLELKGNSEPNPVQ